jgi:hypothetical protein
VFLTRSSHNKGPTTDWIAHFYCPKVPLSIGTTLGALGWLVLKSVFHTPGVGTPYKCRSCKAGGRSHLQGMPFKAMICGSQLFTCDPSHVHMCMAYHSH